MLSRRNGCALWLSLLLSGCGVVVFESPPPEAQVVPLSSRTPPLRTRPPAPPPTEAAKAPRLPPANPPAALDALRRAVRSGAEETTFSSDYPAIINGAIDSADSLRDRADHVGAGKVYRLILEAYPRTPSLAAQVKRSRNALMEDIGLCADRAMESGLAEYRRGRMEQALALWKDILLFDPKNPGARRAAETAKRQMDALRALD